MKRTILYVISALAFALALQSRGIQAAGAKDVDAYLRDIKGKVELKVEGYDDWIKAENGMVLKEGMKVKAGARAEAVIESPRGHAIKLNSLTTITISELSFNKANGSDKSKFDVEQGKIMAKVSKLNDGSRFEVKTPTAVASVRGTRFVVEVDGDASKFLVLEGSLSMITENIESILDQNFQMIVEGGIPAETAPIPDDVRQELNREMGVLEKKSDSSVQGKQQMNNSVNNVVDEGLMNELIEEFGAPGEGCCDR